MGGNETKVPPTPVGQMRFPIDTHHFPKAGGLNVLPGHSQKDPDGELAPVTVAKDKAGGSGLGTGPIRPKNVNSDSPVKDALHTADASGEVYAKHWAQAVKEHPGLVDPKLSKPANELADKFSTANISSPLRKRRCSWSSIRSSRSFCQSQASI